MSRQHSKIGKGVTITPATARPSDPENGDIIYNSSGAKFEKYENGVWSDFASSSNFSNLVADGNAETAPSSIFTPYNDGPGLSRPIDGTGGTSVLTTTVTTTNPLSGSKSFLLTNPGTSAIGQGWAATFPVDLANRAKVLRVSFDYIYVGSSNANAPAEGDFGVFLYDITNSILIEPTNFKLFSNSSTLSDTYSGTFQTSVTGSSYRLIVHTLSANSNNLSLKVDNVSVSPQLVNRGYLGTDFFSVTPPSIVGSSSGIYNPGAGSAYTCEVSLQGEEIIARYYINVGTGATEVTGAYVFSWPAGYAPKTYPFLDVIGNGTISNDATANPVARLTAKYLGTNGFVLDVSDSALVQPGTGQMTTSTHVVSVVVRYKVQGRSASAKMSEPGDERPFLAHAYVGSVTNSTTFNFGPLAIDTHGGWNGTTTYKVTSARRYLVACQMNFNVTASAGQYYNLQVKVNGSVAKYKSHRATGAAVVAQTFNLDLIPLDLKAGDEISFGHDTNFSSVTPAGDPSYFTIISDNGSQQIAASENISARYDTSSGQSIPGGAVWTVVNFATKTRDTHGLVSTGAGWKFTGSTAAVFDVDAKLRFANNQTWTFGNSLAMALFKNGNFYSLLHEPFLQVTHSNPNGVSLVGSDTIDMIAGDYFDIRALHQEATARTLLAIAGYSFVNIKRQGF